MDIKLPPAPNEIPTRIKVIITAISAKGGDGTRQNLCNVSMEF